MNLAISKAKTASIGMAVVRNSNPFGAASSHSMRALAHDMIGFSTTNGPGVNMAIFGAMSPSIGNNAFSYPIPAGEEPPIVLDMACGTVAAGKIGTAQTYSEKPPHNWGLDENGEEADDPSKVAVILPAAGAKKGSALSVVMDVLCGPLSGGLTAIIKMFDPGDAPQRRLRNGSLFPRNQYRESYIR